MGILLPGFPFQPVPEVTTGKFPLATFGVVSGQRIERPHHLGVQAIRPGGAPLVERCTCTEARQEIAPVEVNRLAQRSKAGATDGQATVVVRPGGSDEREELPGVQSEGQSGVHLHCLAGGLGEGDGQGSGGYRLIKTIERLAQVQQPLRLRLVRPEQFAEQRALVGTVGLDCEVGHERSHSVRVKLGQSGTGMLDMEGTQERKGKGLHHCVSVIVLKSYPSTVPMIFGIHDLCSMPTGILATISLRSPGMMIVSE